MVSESEKDCDEDITSLPDDIDSTDDADDACGSVLQVCFVVFSRGRNIFNCISW